MHQGRCIKVGQPSDWLGRSSDDYIPAAESAVRGDVTRRCHLALNEILIVQGYARLEYIDAAGPVEDGMCASGNRRCQGVSDPGPALTVVSSLFAVLRSTAYPPPAQRSR